MNKVRRQKLYLLLIIASALLVATSLILYALRQNISLFYTPTQLVAADQIDKRQIRLGGMVVKGSIHHLPHDLSVEFQITDFNQTVHVYYQGILPDLFREGQGVVVTGERLNAHAFKATQVLAKHDENYMPPEVKSALAAGLKQQDVQP